ncbi:MAG: T9SS type A sorting domain-containing protein [Bacteroidota bacterium]|jgi:hypothetical protein
MKKLLLAILAVAFLQVNAQSNKVRIRITEPVSGSTITAGQPITFKFWVRNIDTATISGSNKVFVSLGSFNGTTFTNQTSPVALANVNIAPGDSQQFTQQYTINVTGGGSGNIGLGLAVWYSADGTNATFNSFSAAAYNLFNSISEAAKAAATVKVYPNPAVNVLNIDLDYEKEKIINLFDITGKVVQSLRTSANRTDIDVSQFNKGMYLYEIRTAGNELIKSGRFNVAH